MQIPQGIKKRLEQKSPKAYSLLMTMVLLSVLSVALGVMLMTIASSARTTRDMVQRRSSFYMCDGFGRVATRLAQDYVLTVAKPNTNDMKKFICDRAGGCTSGNFLPDIIPADRSLKITEFEIKALDEGTTGPIPSGPFTGMNARQNTIQITLRAEDEKTGATCASNQEVTLGQIALFQFFMFGDTYTDFHPGPPQDIQGRVHVNGDFCAGSQSLFRMERITSSGKILSGADTECQVNDFGSDPNIGDIGTFIDTSSVAIGGGFASFARLTRDNNHGCNPCTGPDDTAANSGLSWESYALATWAGNVLDSDHNVPTLRPPVTGTPQAQRGANAQGVAVSNNGNMRFLVDPVLSDDPDDVRAQKFAQKADIRIVNGVWYLRNPDNSEDWPGVPVWSDHPGSFTTINEEGIEGATKKVGQQNLWNDGAGAGPVDWNKRPGTDKAPRRFSYYRTDVLAKKGLLKFQTSDNVSPIVSYGSLKLNTATGKWAPGHWVGTASPLSGGFFSPLCPLNSAARKKMSIEEIKTQRTVNGVTTEAAGCRHNVVGEGNLCYGKISSIGGVSIAGTDVDAVGDSQVGIQTGLRSFSDAIACSGSPDNPNIASGLLNSTRSGFMNTHQFVTEQDNALATTKYGAATAYPMNFDIGALQDALKDTTAGELGSYFCSAGGNCFMKAPFNGIVYITNTWPGALSGIRNDQSPVKPPKQGYLRVNRANAAIPQAVAPTGVPANDAPLGSTPGTDLNLGTYDLEQIAHTYTRVFAGNLLTFAQQRALPYNLCSDPGSPGETGPGQGFDKAVGGLTTFSRFVIPSCADYQKNNGLTARINSVRVFNGATIDEKVLPKGLTVSTNLPVYIMGEMNTSSKVTPADATPWRPLLVTGDMAFVLSKAWSDEAIGWHASLVDTIDKRLAQPTQYNMEVLAGWTPSANNFYSGGANNYMRYLECWRGSGGQTSDTNHPHILRGSFVMAFNSIYIRTPRGQDLFSPQAYCAPIRDWSFDNHLDQITNQPPGAPLFEVSAIRKWERDTPQ